MSIRTRAKGRSGHGCENRRCASILPAVVSRRQRRREAVADRLLQAEANDRRNYNDAMPRVKTRPPATQQERDLLCGAWAYRGRGELTGICGASAYAIAHFPLELPGIDDRAGGGSGDFGRDRGEANPGSGFDRQPLPPYAGKERILRAALGKVKPMDVTLPERRGAPGL